jgi:para-aminobenzoate synthetase component 1
VIGKLRADLQLVDLLKATFPGGSITGAPKLRAMEIIAELEPTQRGPYCGSVVYLGFDGRMDSSIIIRSFSIKDKTVSFQAGGAVVADSEPKQEREEVLTKARALFKALGSAYDFAY